jgi:DNA end-binding protein Ku
LHYAEEVKEADAFFRQIGDRPGDPALVAMAAQLIESKSAPFDAKAYHDNYEKALRELVAKKVKAMPKKAKQKSVATDKGRIACSTSLT